MFLLKPLTLINIYLQSKLFINSLTFFKTDIKSVVFIFLVPLILLKPKEVQNKTSPDISVILYITLFEVNKMDKITNLYLQFISWYAYNF